MLEISLALTGGARAAHPKQVSTWPCCVAPASCFVWIGLQFQKAESPPGSGVTLLCVSSIAGHPGLGLKTPSGCCSSLFICADTRGRSLGGRSRAHVRQCISGQRAVHCARGRGRLPSSSCPGRSWSPSEGLWKFYLRIKGRGATERAHTGWGPCWVHFFFFSLLLLS